MSLRDGLNLLAQPPYNAVIARPQRGRGNLKAVIHRTFQPDDASQRLPRACGPRNDPMGERIATSASPPRNDRGNRSPGADLTSVIARPRRGRGNLLAAIHRILQPNDASQRLPRACGPRNGKTKRASQRWPSIRCTGSCLPRKNAACRSAGCVGAFAITQSGRTSAGRWRKPDRSASGLPWPCRCRT